MPAAARPASSRRPAPKSGARAKLRAVPAAPPSSSKPASSKPATSSARPNVGTRAMREALLETERAWCRIRCPGNAPDGSPELRAGWAAFYVHLSLLALQEIIDRWNTPEGDALVEAASALGFLSMSIRNGRWTPKREPTDVDAIVARIERRLLPEQRQAVQHDLDALRAAVGATSTTSTPAQRGEQKAAPAERPSHRAMRALGFNLDRVNQNWQRFDELSITDLFLQSVDSVGMGDPCLSMLRGIHNDLDVLLAALGNSEWPLNPEAVESAIYAASQRTLVAEQLHARMLEAVDESTTRRRGASLTAEQIAKLAAKLRKPDGTCRSPEAYAGSLGLRLQEAPELDARWPATIEGDVLAYRPGPYAARSILMEIANRLLEREGVRATVKDVRDLAFALMEPSP